jgi:hypothetical protein
MTTLKSSALAYTAPAKLRNIVELPKVSVQQPLETKTGKNKDGEEYSIDYITVDGEQYRVPPSVLKSLKLILEENPNLKEFKVKKNGQGLDTEYTVIPLS